MNHLSFCLKCRYLILRLFFFLMFLAVFNLQKFKDAVQTFESERATCSVVPDSLRPRGLWPARLSCPWDSPAKDTGVGCHALPRGSSQPRDWTQVSLIPGRFFTVWATREFHTLWCLAVGESPHHYDYLGNKDHFFLQFFCIFLPPLLNIFCFISVLYCAHLCMKYSLNMSNFLEKILSLSLYVFSLYFFALFT